MSRPLMPAGAVTGYYAYYGRNLPTFSLIRDPDGSMTSFVVSGATNTYPLGINASGTVIGYYTDANTAYHGFERSPDGTITTFDAPGAGTTYELGTLPFSINDAGVITGRVSDQNWVYHGSIATYKARRSSIPTICPWVRSHPPNPVRAPRRSAIVVRSISIVLRSSAGIRYMKERRMFA